ncbi:MAG: hypothetical protein RL282_869 [Bacteroidota bacterium]|jgi:hypothetical protein
MINITSITINDNQLLKKVTDLDTTYARSRRFEVDLIKACIIKILTSYYGKTSG